ncbi:hypothetical protein [Kalamiella sp. sgz302252]|uniref:hypothetical protein n=1 Tax=Pantoea sp. sgz302252 TaxID=3341827 RepID=UPI0036D2FC20
MKYINLLVGIALSISSTFSIAGTTLKYPDSDSGYISIIKKAEKAGLADVNIDDKQKFNIINDNKNIGILVQGKGWLRDVHPVCFIGWSADHRPNAFFMQTMGADDWETVDCDKVQAVGIISRSDDKNIKIAVIYKINVRGQYSQDYVILGIKDGESIFYDKNTTERFQNSYIEDLVAMRKEYQRLISNNK